MKRAIYVTLAVAATVALARGGQVSVAKGESELFASNTGNELVIDGAPAEAIFRMLDGKPQRVNSPDGNWINKFARGIFCGQNEKTGQYSCTIDVNKKGIAQ